MKIKATILAVLYPKTTSDIIPAAKNFFVLLTTLGKASGATRVIPQKHHTYTFAGEYAIYQGQQTFRFSSIEEDIPLDPKALLEYACLITKGLGPAFSEATWKQFGPDFRKKLEAAETKTSRQKQLLESLRELDQAETQTKIIATLIKAGLTQHLAELAYQHLGEATLSIIKSNPYTLAEIPGQSFLTIDARLREPPFSIQPTNPHRLAAFLTYTLSTLAESEGHTLVYTPINALLQNILPEQTLSTIDTTFPAIIQHLSTQSGPAICLKKYRTIADNILEYIKKPTSTLLKNITSTSLNDADQQAATRSALATTGLHLINGGAGTGKTTLIKTIAQLLTEHGRPFSIASFAGKAAARIREATGFPASTIHSLLCYTPEKGFTVKSLEGQTVIIDEASMVPSHLLSRLISTNPASLILVGDEAQLPPVGPGAPFHSLIQYAHASHISTLTTSHRNKAAINQAASLIRAGQLPPDLIESEYETFRVLHIKSPEEAQSYIASILQHLDFSQDIIISPRNGSDEPNTPATAHAINQLVLSHLNLTHPAINERIICLKNTPRLNVWNGTTATIDAIDIDGNAYITTDESQEVRLPENYLKSSTAPAYALTIHKAQGSQYRRVVILILKRDLHALLSRQMLYTAITRAKHACLILTDLTSLSPVIQKQTHRDTILSELLKQSH